MLYYQYKFLYSFPKFSHWPNQTMKKKYYEHKFNTASKNIKQTWRMISNTINNKKNCKVETTVKNIIQHDVVHEDSEETVNMFNDYFVGIEKNIAESKRRKNSLV